MAICQTRFDLFHANGGTFVFVQAETDNSDFCSSLATRNTWSINALGLWRMIKSDMSILFSGFFSSNWITIREQYFWVERTDHFYFIEFYGRTNLPEKKNWNRQNNVPKLTQCTNVVLAYCLYSRTSPLGCIILGWHCLVSGRRHAFYPLSGDQLGTIIDKGCREFKINESTGESVRGYTWWSKENNPRMSSGARIQTCWECI